jgi:nucleoside 2-deoxyribosyltransferase
MTNIYSQKALKFFISHRDSKKKEAKELANLLQPNGISCFVAHDSINPNTLWKEEIHKALLTMDGFICFITNDYYESLWTNQEVGFALAKEVPIFLYSFDKTDPKGFRHDVQAIKGGYEQLFKCITDNFPQNLFLKQAMIENFLKAKDGTFMGAKSRFSKIIGLKFNDAEIDKIVSAIQSPANYMNQLICLLYDRVEESSEFNQLSTEVFYRDLLDKYVLQQHSEKRYIIEADNDERYKIKDLCAVLQ